MATYISISCNVLFLIRGLYIKLHNMEFRVQIYLGMGTEIVYHIRKMRIDSMINISSIINIQPLTSLADNITGCGRTPDQAPTWSSEWNGQH